MIEPAGRSQLGYMDWVGGNGLPYRATLYDDGKWSCSEPVLDVTFAHCFDPSETGVAGAYGFRALYDAADAFGGHAHYTAPLIRPALDDGEVE